MPTADNNARDALAHIEREATEVAGVQAALGIVCPDALDTLFVLLSVPFTGTLRLFYIVFVSSAPASAHFKQWMIIF